MHYLRAWRAGTLSTEYELAPVPFFWHRLSDKDVENKTGTCSICGPVRIHRGHHAWVCNTVRERYWAEGRKYKDKYYEYTYGDGARINYQDAAAARERLAAKQQERCAICSKAAPENGKQLGLDHCHKTGKIRGLLCDTCNLGLGYFRDNPGLLRAAAQYLEDDD
jgi:hypothetical protein